MADDLDQRLRGALDRVPTSDVWGEATRPGRPEHPLPHGPSRGRRVVIAGFAFLVFVVAIGSVAVRRNGREDLAPPIGRGPSTGLVMDGTLRCTVSVEDHVVPGAPLPITFILTNVSSETQQVMEGTPSFTYMIESADGSTFDTSPDTGWLSGKYNDPFPLAPGASWSAHDLLRLRIQSPGPLTITPRCMQTPLAPIRVDVQAEGAAPSAEAAVASAVGSASGLFDGCLPAPNEEAVVGEIRPPKGSGVSPMPARCSARVQAYDGFDVVSFLIVAPPTAGDVQIPDGIPTEQNVQLPTAPTVDLIVWRFVVTADRTVSVYAFHRSKTQPSDATAPMWEVTAAGWNGPGGGICGSEGVGRGIDGPLVDFVNVCPGF